MTDSLCIFCHLAVQKLVSAVIRIVDCVKAAGSNTTATAFAFIIINNGFFIRIRDSITSAFFGTAFAATAQIFINSRFSTLVLFHFTGTTSTAHTDILNCTTKTGSFMTFEMGQTDEDICIHDSAADLCSFAILTVYNGNFDLVCSAKSIADQNLTASADGVESVQVRTIQVFQCILAAARI